MNRAFEWQLDEGERTAAVRQATHPANPAIQVLDVKRVSGGADVGDNHFRSRHYQLRMSGIRRGQAGAQHLEARRFFMRDQIQIFAVQIKPGDFIRFIGSLLPLRVPSRIAVERQAVYIELALDAMNDQPHHILWGAGGIEQDGKVVFRDFYVAIDLISKNCRLLIRIVAQRMAIGFELLVFRSGRRIRAKLLRTDVEERLASWQPTGGSELGAVDRVR